MRLYSKAVETSDDSRGKTTPASATHAKERKITLITNIYPNSTQTPCPQFSFLPNIKFPCTFMRTGCSVSARSIQTW